MMEQMQSHDGLLMKFDIINYTPFDGYLFSLVDIPVDITRVNIERLVIDHWSKLFHKSLCR